MPELPSLQLSPIEARVLGVLIEKEKTVPDTYPLTLNALQSGCNQKTSRDPVMNCHETELQEALDSLKRRSLVFETSGGRVMRYSHNTRRVLEIPSESVALVATLMLRGPQTAGELRINCERLCRFSDISAVQGFLDELAARSAGPLVVELPRQPGSRENRWMHLLCGAPEPGLLARAAHSEPGSTDPSRADAGRAQAPGSAGSSTAAGIPGAAATADSAELLALQTRVQALEDEVRELREGWRSLCEQLGVSPAGDPPDR